MEVAKKMRYIETKKRKGFIQGLVMAFVALVAVGFAILVYMYVGSTLDTAFNSSCTQYGAGTPWCSNVSNHSLEWRNISASVVNFTGQLGTVGTIAGITLLLILVGGVGYYALNRGSGGNSGM